MPGLAGGWDPAWASASVGGSAWASAVASGRACRSAPWSGRASAWAWNPRHADGASPWDPVRWGRGRRHCPRPPCRSPCRRARVCPGRRECRAGHPAGTSARRAARPSAPGSRGVRRASRWRRRHDPPVQAAGPRPPRSRPAPGRPRSRLRRRDPATTVSTRRRGRARSGGSARRRRLRHRHGVAEQRAAPVPHRGRHARGRARRDGWRRVGEEAGESRGRPERRVAVGPLGRRARERVSDRRRRARGRLGGSAARVGLVPPAAQRPRQRWRGPGRRARGRAAGLRRAGAGVEGVAAVPSAAARRSRQLRRRRPSRLPTIAATTIPRSAPPISAIPSSGITPRRLVVPRTILYDRGSRHRPTPRLPCPYAWGAHRPRSPDDRRPAARPPPPPLPWRPLVRLPRARPRLPRLRPRERDGPRPVVHGRGERRRGGAHLAAAREPSRDQPPRPSRGLPRRPRPGRRLGPRRPPVHGLRGARAVGSRRGVRELRRRDRDDHQQDRLEVVGRHPRHRHALRGLGAPGLRREGRDACGHRRRVRRWAGGAHRRARGGDADRERARPDRRPVRPRDPDARRHLQRVQRAGVGLPRDHRWRADRVRPAARWSG